MDAPSFDASCTGTQLASYFEPQIKGKVILTTSVSPRGLGAVFCEAISIANPALLILAGRNFSVVDKEAQTITSKGVEVRTLQLDLSSLANVRAAAQEINSWSDVPVLDELVNNAGIVATDYAKSPDGFELQFATNFLGPFLFTNLIMSKLLASREPRVVNVSSDGHRLSPFRFADYNFDDGNTYEKWVSYGQSKTANILFSVSLANKLGSRLSSCSLHPGVIASTSLACHIDWENDKSLRQLDRTLGNAEGWRTGFQYKNLDEGVATHIFGAFSPSLKGVTTLTKSLQGLLMALTYSSENNGAYLQDSHLANPRTETVKAWATSSIEAEMLWELSEKLVGQSFIH